MLPISENYPGMIAFSRIIADLEKLSGLDGKESQLTDPNDLLLFSILVVIKPYSSNFRPNQSCVLTNGQVLLG